ncbi:MAG: ornithine cyclodeaminase [Pseudomonadota bacterium]
MQPTYITYEDAYVHLTWDDAVEAIRSGHTLPKAEIGDLFLGPDSGTMLNRAAFIDSVGYGLKSVTVFSGNAARNLPTVQGAMMVFDPHDGQLRAIIESRLVTEFKTAADSVLGAKMLARADSRKLLVVGAGTVAGSLIKAYSAAMPSLTEITIWARRAQQAEALLETFDDHPVTLKVSDNLETACETADIISCATMAREPILRGENIKPGTHVDLIGAFKANMREADDALISGGSLYVDSRDTTIGHIGEIIIPMQAGVITEASIRGDLYDLIAGDISGRKTSDEVTIFKNGGGAHLDLMIASYIAKQLAAENKYVS